MMIVASIFMILTILVLVAGLVIMAIGGNLNAKYSKKLMTMRVILQFTSLLILFILFASSS